MDHGLNGLIRVGVYVNVFVRFKVFYQLKRDEQFLNLYLCKAILQERG